MKNLMLLGILFLSSAAFAQSTNIDAGAPDTPDIIIDNLSGSVDGYSTRNGDDQLDFGLVIPTLTKSQVMDFNLSYVLSSETSVIRAVGQRINIPSNLSLPKQSERYSFFTIRIDKPEFKLPIATVEVPTEVVVLEGSIPFTRTVDTLRADKPLFAVVNFFDLTSYTVVAVNDPEAPIAMTVGNNTIDGDALEFVNPFAEDRDFVSLGLNMASTLDETGITRHFPVDIKTLERPQILKTDAGSKTTPILVSIPKSVFDSATDASSKPFPFTMVWGDAAPTNSLPLAKTFMSLNDSLEERTFDIDYDQIPNVSTIAMNAVFTDAEGNEVSSVSINGDATGVTSLSVPVETKRIRVDVYAIDTDPVKASIIVENALTDTDIINEAKYITRYEEDLN